MLVVADLVLAAPIAALRAATRARARPCASGETGRDGARGRRTRRAAPAAGPDPRRLGAVGRREPARPGAGDPGRRAADCAHRAAPVPPRRAAGGAGDDALLRPAAGGRPAATAAGARAACGCCRRSRRASSCPRSWPGCARSTAPSSCASAVRAASSTRCASTSSATTCARSTGGPRARARDVVVRTWRPERDRHIVLAIDTGRTSAARIGRRDRAARTPRSTRADAACCWPRSPRAPAIGSRWSPPTPGCGPGSGCARAQTSCRAWSTALTPLEPSLAETDPLLLSGEVIALGRQALAGRAVHRRWTPGAAETGLMPAARALAGPPPGRGRLGRRPAAGASSRRRGPTSPTSTPRRRPSCTIAARERAARAADPAGLRASSTPRSTSFASKVADAYLDLKAAGRL